MSDRPDIDRAKALIDAIKRIEEQMEANPDLMQSPEWSEKLMQYWGFASGIMPALLTYIEALEAERDTAIERADNAEEWLSLMTDRANEALQRVKEAEAERDIMRDSSRRDE